MIRRGALLWLLLLVWVACPQPANARSVVTPWKTDVGFENLVYGSSSTTDVQRIMGEAPDEIIRSEQMYPLIENHYYYDEKGSGAATVFVFENNALLGMHYKTPGNHFVDLTYVLPDNGDRQLQTPFLGNYASYFPFFPFVEF